MPPQSRGLASLYILPRRKGQSLSAMGGGIAAQSIINTTFPKLSFDSIRW